MDCNEVKIGQRIVTTELGPTAGMMISPKHLAVRQQGKQGEILSYVPGHGGDVWWVKHIDDGTIAAYSVSEMAVANA